ncbi:MAG: FCD domain-containing protein, partial [Verrucomicrobia bacterium]|nr:FCD domain-containing protein [Verrucomicrobiota bacterium]
HAGFHQALVAACGSNKLLQIRSQLYEQSERYRRYSGVVARERDVSAEHRRIFDATIARDAGAATEAITEHLRLTAEILVSSLADGKGLGVATPILSQGESLGVNHHLQTSPNHLAR